MTAPLASKRLIESTRGMTQRVARLLTNSKIPVYHIGSQAYVKWDGHTHKAKYVNLPVIPDACSAKFCHAIIGFLLHECCHMLYTDPAAVQEAQEKSDVFGGLNNAIEDCFIERRGEEDFAGGFRELDLTREIWLTDIVNAGIVQENANLNNKMEVLNRLVTACMRAESGQKTVADYIEEHYKEETEWLFKALRDLNFSDRIKNCEDSWDVLRLTQIVYAKFFDKPKRDPSPQQDEDESEGEESEEGEQPGNNDDAETFQEDLSEPEQGDQSEPGEGGETEEGEEGEQSESEGQNEGSNEAGAESEQGDEDDDNGEVVDEEGSEEPDAEVEQGGAGEGEESEEESEDDSPSSGSASIDEDAPEDEEEGETPPGAGEANDEDEPASDEEEGGGVADDTSEADESDDPFQDEASDEDRDDESDGFGAALGLSEDEAEVESFDDMLEGMVQGQFRDVPINGTYTPFSTASDVQAKTKPGRHLEGVNAEISKLEAATGGMTGQVSRSLIRHLRSMEKKSWEANQRSGRLNPNAIARLSIGEERVFRKKRVVERQGASIMLLIDCSGSMEMSGKWQLAFESAYAMAESLNAVKINFAIMGFVTALPGPDMLEDPRLLPSDQVQRMVDDQARLAYRSGNTPFARFGPVFHPIFKGFDERWGLTAKRRIADWHMELPVNGGNADPDALISACRMLETQQTTKKGLIVLSDGNPAYAAGGGMGYNEAMCYAIKQLEKADISVSSIGIKDSSVSHYYKNFEVLHNINDLGGSLIRHVGDMLK